MACTFCTDAEIQSRVIYKNDLVWAFPTNIPIVPGHVMICPVRCIKTISDVTDEEFLAIRTLILRLRESLQKSFAAEGFNYAWNEGLAGGQSIQHLHIHMLPRTSGDTGITSYDPRQFLYRPGSRDISPEDELQEVAALIQKNLHEET